MIALYQDKRPKMAFAIVCLLGFVLGAGSVLGQFFSTNYLQTRYGTEFLKSPDELLVERILIEAESPILSYRSASFGIQPDTPLHASIMAEQSAIIGQYEQIAEAASTAANEDNMAAPPKWRVETYFARTVSIGPLSSILRTDYVERDGQISRQSYASTLVNTLRPEGFSFTDLFYDSRDSTVRLDRALCEAVMAEKKRRIGSETIRGDLIDCKRDRRLSFLHGAPVVLLPSSERNKIGGLSFYYERGRVGDPSEGDYIIHMPQSAFRLDVRPEWIGLFGGEPIIEG